MSSVWAPELYRLANEIRAMAGPWPSDAAVRHIHVLEYAARDLIALDRPRQVRASLCLRSAAAFARKRRRK